MILRPFLYHETACASYLIGCLTHGQLAVVDPHESLVDEYLAEAERAGAPIVAGFETHVHGGPGPGLPASPVCRRWSRPPARPPTCRPGRASSSSITHLQTARWSSWGTPSCAP